MFIISEILFMVKSLCLYVSQTERVTGIERTLSNYKDYVPTVQGTHYIPFRKISWLMPDVEIIAFCRKNHIGHINTQCEKCSFFLCYAWRHAPKFLSFKN